MCSRKYIFFQISAILFCCFYISKSEQEIRAVEKILSQCKKTSPKFDACMKRALNELRPYFKRGIPEIGVVPFDPHFAAVVKQTRKMFGVGYTLVLRNAYERGWTQSVVTKFKTDWDNAMIVYAQYFPEKSIEAEYEFKSELFGSEGMRSGLLNLTLRDYSQTTRVARSATGCAVHVEVDHIGDMDIRISNLLNGRTALEQWLDGIINALWKPGFILMRPAINDLVSTAFTDIWSKSFKEFNIEQFIKD